MELQINKLEQILITEILGANVYKKFLEGDLGRGILGEHIDKIVTLAGFYNSQKHQGKYHSINEAQAYALYYLPINYFKILHLFKQLPFEFKDRPISLLDFGSGPGSASLASLSFFPQLQQITLVDRSKSNLELAQRLIQGYNRSMKVETCSNLVGTASRFDLIIAANVINEVAFDQRLKQLQQFEQLLNPNGIMIILEPALQGITRELMQLRDKLFNTSSLIPLYPCTHTQACPMLINSKQDWCHAEIGSAGSRLVEEIDRLTGFNKHRLKFSGLILSNGYELNQGWRIVDFPKKRKGYLFTKVCGPQIYQELKLSKQESARQIHQLIPAVDPEKNCNSSD